MNQQEVWEKALRITPFDIEITNIQIEINKIEKEINEKMKLLKTLNDRKTIALENKLLHCVNYAIEHIFYIDFR